MRQSHVFLTCCQAPPPDSSIIVAGEGARHHLKVGAGDVPREEMSQPDPNLHFRAGRPPLADSKISGLHQQEDHTVRRGGRWYKKQSLNLMFSDIW
ncbi:MAG: hypothetical protein SGI97_07895 [candidate division Zixibacteria bacterium]|nr:hypothetical protein [candidate division Zixibacteria bacterium]